MVILHKRNAQGGRFGFVRFIGVKDQMGLERKLDNIWIGLYKLRANVARFIHGRTQMGLGSQMDLCGRLGLRMLMH